MSYKVPELWGHTGIRGLLSIHKAANPAAAPSWHVCKPASESTAMNSKMCLDSHQDRLGYRILS